MIEGALDTLANWLMRADAGVGLVLSVALLLVIGLFHQSWQAGYRRLASEQEPLDQR